MIFEDFQPAHSITQSFHDTGVERSFQEAYFENNLRLGRFCHLAAVFFYLLYAFWDIWVVAPSRAALWIPVIPVVCVLFAFGLFSSFYLQKFYRKYWQQLYAVYVLATAGGFTFVTGMSNTFDDKNFVGIIFCLFFCYTFIRLRFILAVAAGWAAVLIYLLVLIFVVYVPLPVIGTEAFYLFGISLLGMMIAYGLEYYARRDFLLNVELRRAKDAANNVSARLERMVNERTAQFVSANEELRETVQRERGLVRRLEEEEAVTRKNLFALQQAEKIAQLGYFEYDWRTGDAYWSPGFYTLLGLHPDEPGPEGLQISEYVHPDDRPWVEDQVGSALESKRPLDIEFRLVQKSGGVLHIRGVAETTYKNERPSVTSGTIQNISDYKAAEAERRTLEERLQQSRKLESIGRLAGGVAHDFNNMLTAILGDTRICLDMSDEGSQLQEYLLEIQNAGERATGLTRQLLGFARKQAVAPEVLDINETISGLIEMLQRLIEENIELIWSPGPEAWNVRIDPHQLDQLMVNLTVNARDAITGAGRITIKTENVLVDETRAALEADAAPGEYVVLSISDTGSGMDEETMAKVFEPFFTTKGVGQGTGMGLATVHGIVKQNDGFISVQSEKGGGTTFKIHFPRCTLDVESKTDTAGDQSMPVGSETILLVEDESAILRMGQRILEELGYTVLAAGAPSEAISTAECHSGRIDLLVTDVIMPEINGRELADRMLDRYPDLKVLFISGYTADVIATQGILDEGIHFIGKPFAKQDLAFKIREILNSTPLEAGSPDSVEPGKGGESMPGKNILFVDDEDGIIKMVRRLLRKTDINLIEAFSGEQALGIFEERRGEIDLVVIDLGMPGMGGKAAALKMLEIDPATKIFIASGYGSDSPECESLKGQVAGFLDKPFSKADMLHAVEQAGGPVPVGRAR